jgi:hypothetical protein
MSTPARVETFEGDALAPCWHPWTAGSGSLAVEGGVLRCILDPADIQHYSDAQISDYGGLPRRAFPWWPPLRLTVRAWASHSAEALRGTAGFGLWNEPFVFGGRRVPRPPRAAWFFFASPPSNMALARDVPGWGWKAATIDAARPTFVALTPLALPGFVAMRVPALYRALWPLAQRAIGVSEARLPADLATPHTYALEWRADGVRFAVDGQTVHSAPCAPRGPLGFIAWLDNQYAVVTPAGRFRFGLLATTERQWLALDHIALEPL